MSIFVKYSISDVWQGSKCASVIFSRFFHTFRLTFTCYFQKSTKEKWYFSNHVVCLVCQKQTDFNSQNDIFSYSFLKNFKFSVWRNVWITIFLFWSFIGLPHNNLVSEAALQWGSQEKMFWKYAANL